MLGSLTKKAFIGRLPVDDPVDIELEADRPRKVQWSFNTVTQSYHEA